MNIDITKIPKMISDVRKKAQYSYTGEDGLPFTVEIVSFPMAEDLIQQGMQNIVAEMMGIAEYASIQDRNTVTELVKSHIPVRRR